MSRPGGPELGAEELERYSRQLLLREIGEEGQLRLRAGSALVVGCGGLGVPAALYLAAAGVGRVVLADPDVLALDNLARQVAYRTAELGEAKADLLASRLLELNPTIRVEPRVELVTESSLAAFLEGSDIVLECSDDPPTKFLVNDGCVERGVALVVGGAVGLSGQVVAVPAGAPCYRCLFRGPPAEGGLTCRDLGVLGPLVGVIGAMQALQALRILCGIGHDQGGRLLDFEAATARWREVRFPPDPGCPAHSGWSRRARP